MRKTAKLNRNNCDFKLDDYKGYKGGVKPPCLYAAGNGTEEFYGIITQDACNRNICKRSGYCGGYRM